MLSPDSPRAPTRMALRALAPASAIFLGALLISCGLGQDIIVVPPSPPVITYASPQTFSVGVAATQAVSSTGGTVTGYTIAPPLPAGLVLDASTGLIAGLALDTSAESEYTVIATGPGGADTAVFLLRAVAVPVDPAVPRPHIAYVTPVTDTAGTAASHPVISTGGPTTGFSLMTPLPPGLTLNSSSGLIAGTPTTPRSAVAHAVIAYGPGGRDTAMIVITVAANSSVPLPQIAYTSPVTDTVGRPAAHAVISTDGPVTSYRLLSLDDSFFHVFPKSQLTIIPQPWHYLPSGLILDTATGMISGTPTHAKDSATYRIIATGPGGSDTATINITVVQPAAPALPPVIAYASPVTDTVGRPAAHAVISTGGPVTSYSHRLLYPGDIVPAFPEPPALPLGLVLNVVSGMVSGTPTVATATTAFIIAHGPGGSDTAQLNITVVSGLEAQPVPLIYWDFNEGAGTILTDRGAGGRHATISGATWIPGLEGTALRFDGVNDYAMSTAIIPDMEKQTMMAWVYLESIKEGYLVGEGDWQSGHDNLLSVHSNGRFRYRTRDPDPWDQHNSQSVLTTGRWYHLAGVSTGDSVRVYLDGQLDTVYTGRQYNLLGYHYHIEIGRFNGDGNARDYLHGRLDEVKIFDIALTSQQIQTEWLRHAPIIVDFFNPNPLPKSSGR